MSGTNERRHFHRIPFEASAELYQGDQRWPIVLHDLSLKGLLADIPTHWDTANTAEPFEAVLTLGEDVEVCMVVTLAHAFTDKLGFECQRIDLDSITHLRRLIELNLGSHDLLERDLAELSHTPNAH